jgi:crossover junction endodeoxyribonuclease RusA
MWLCLPHPPTTNKYWRHVGSKVLLSSAGRQFRQRVVTILSILGFKPMRGPLAVTIDVFPPDRRRRDIDNITKALLDALQHGGAYIDDSQIVELHIRKQTVEAPDGKVLVTIQPVEDHRDEN